MTTISRFAGLMIVCLLSLNATLGLAKDVTPQPAVQGTWILIGNIRGGRAPSRDTLRLRGAHTYFRSIKFSVANATVHLDSMAITFTDGSQATIAIHGDIPPGAESRAFDLPGFRRNIRRIELWHQTVDRFQGRGVVSVFGLT